MRNLGQFSRVMICLGLIVLSTGCSTTNGRMMNRVGMRQYQKGNHTAARQNFTRAVADDPYHPDYRHNLAMAMQKQGDTPGAERVLRHNLSLDPMHQPTYHALAQNLVQQQRHGEAGYCIRCDGIRCSAAFSHLVPALCNWYLACRVSIGIASRFRTGRITLGESCADATERPGTYQDLAFNCR